MAFVEYDKSITYVIDLRLAIHGQKLAACFQHAASLIYSRTKRCAVFFGLQSTRLNARLEAAGRYEVVGRLVE
jgi:hypothetical protein